MPWPSFVLDDFTLPTQALGYIYLSVEHLLRELLVSFPLISCRVSDSQ